MIKHIFLFLFLSVVCSINSQEYFDSNKIKEQRLTYKEMPKDGHGRDIFQIIGYSNNVDVRKVYLDIKYRLLTRLSKNSDNRLIVNINTTKVAINGNINIRDFAIDTLLWPTEYSAKLLIINGRHVRDELLIKNQVFGGTIAIDLSDYISANIGELSISVTDVGFHYNKTSLTKLEELTESIKYYYSYGLLLDYIFRERSNQFVKNEKSANGIFLQKIELDRIDSYLESHSFYAVLNLRNRDPIGFIKQKMKFNRLKKRSNTLFNNEIIRNDISAADPSVFCNNYYKLSLNYLIKTNSLQPTDALGFEEVAKINNNTTEINSIRLISDCYDKSLSVNNINIGKCIFNHFVSSSIAYVKEENYSDALVTLNNSKIISNWFDVPLTPSYSYAAMETLDGVASSYLRVGSMALNANNLALAEQYISMSDMVLSKNLKLLNNVDLNDSSFADFVGLQNIIAIEYIEAGMHNRALSSLLSAKKICINMESSYFCQKVDSVICELHIDFIDFKLDNLEQLIADFQYPDAFDSLLSTNHYIIENGCYNSYNSRFEELSNSLFLEFRQQGEILINAKQSNMALEKLLKARTVQEIRNGDLLGVNELIKKAAEPEILKIIDQAKYHTWANRTDEALLLNSEAINLNYRYFNNSNNKINFALEDLKNQMKLRKCRDYSNGYSDAIKKAKILISKKQYGDLVDILKKAEEFVVDYPECKIDNSELLKLRTDYQSVLQFYIDYNSIGTKLFDKGYQDAIAIYIELMDYYKSEELEDYNITFYSLEDFIKKQQLPELTLETATHYLQGSSPELGLLYLKIYEDQGGDSKKSKKLVTAIAKKLAKRDDANGTPVSESLSNYNYDDGWFNTFKVTYVKNRVIK